MSEFNFKSQVCTDKNQSKRLLALGLKKETADMRYYALYISTVDKWYNKEYPEVLYDGERINNHDIPAWSLGRLLALVNGEDWRVEITLKDERYGIHYGYESYWYDDIFEAVIAWIEDDIKEGCFNKEYLV